MDKKKIILLSLGHLSCDVNSGALPAALPFVQMAHGLSYQATGGLMFAYSCLSFIIQPLFGLLADRLSKPWFIPLGVLLAGCGLATIGFLGAYWAIFLAITISGIGAALFHPEGARYANRFSGQSKGVGLSIFSIGGNSGFVLGPLLVTACVGTAGLHGMAVFALLALCTASMLLWQIVRMTSLSAPQSTEKKTADAANAASPAGSAASSSASSVSGHKTVSPQIEEKGENNWREFSKLTVTIMVRSTLFVGMSTFIPLYWVNVFGQTETAGSLAMTVFCACGVFFNITGGILADRYGYLRMIRIGFVGMAPVVFAFSLASELWLAYAILPLLGFVLYVPFSSQVVLGQKLLARNIGFASGVTLGLATSIGGLAAPVLGWIADSHGITTALQCMAAVSLLGLVFAFLLSAGPSSKSSPEKSPRPVHSPSSDARSSGGKADLSSVRAGAVPHTRTGDDGTGDRA